MAVISAVIAVTAAPVLIGPSSDTDYAPGTSMAVKNTGAVSVFIGGPGVTATTGYPLAVGEALAIDLAPGSMPYACVVSTAGSVTMLGSGT